MGSNARGPNAPICQTGRRALLIRPVWFAPLGSHRWQPNASCFIAREDVRLRHVPGLPLLRLIHTWKSEAVLTYLFDYVIMAESTSARSYATPTVKALSHQTSSRYILQNGLRTGSERA